MPPRSTQRLFIAADPPAELAEALSAWARGQRGDSQGVRVMPPRSIHLTLAFLGEQPLDAAEAIVSAMAAAAQQYGEMRLALADPLLLPPRRPRVLAAAIGDPSDRLAELQRTLAEELHAAIGWSEERAFRPHLTLARLGRGARIGGELAPLPEAEFVVGELVLYRSFLEQSGARYEALDRVALR